MTEEVIRTALNDGLLKQAHTATAVGRYDIAFELILTVLATNSANLKAHFDLLEAALHALESRFVASRLLRYRFYTENTPRHVSPIRLFEVRSMGLSGLIIIDQSLLLKDAQMKSLLRISRNIWSDGGSREISDKDAGAFDELFTTIARFVESYEDYVQVYKELRIMNLHNDLGEDFLELFRSFGFMYSRLRVERGLGEAKTYALNLITDLERLVGMNDRAGALDLLRNTPTRQRKI